MGKRWTWFLCILFVWLLSFFIFFYTTFPDRAMGTWLEKMVRENTGQDVSIDGLHLLLNTDFLIDSVEYKKNIGKDRLSLRLNNIRINPYYIMLIMGRPYFTFSGEIIAGGNFSGEFRDGKQLNFRWDNVSGDVISGAGFIQGFIKPDTLIGGRGDLLLKRKGEVKKTDKLKVKVKGMEGPFNEIKLPPMPISSQFVITGSIEMTLLTP